MRSRIAWFWIVFVLGLAVGHQAFAEGERFRTLNAGSEGQTVDLTSHLVEGKLNIIDFHSDYCAPSKAFNPALEKLTLLDPNLVVGQVDINRPGTRGIDWNSPVALQYNLRNIPHFKIYDASGELVAEGEEAKERIRELIQKYGLE